MLHQSCWLRSTTQVSAHAGEDGQLGEHSSTTGTCTSTKKQIWQFLRTLGINLPEDQLYHSWSCIQSSLYPPTMILTQQGLVQLY